MSNHKTLSLSLPYPYKPPHLVHEQMTKIIYLLFCIINVSFDQ